MKKWPVDMLWMHWQEAPGDMRHLGETVPCIVVDTYDPRPSAFLASSFLQFDDGFHSARVTIYFEPNRECYKSAMRLARWLAGNLKANAEGKDISIKRAKGE